MAFRWHLGCLRVGFDCEGMLGEYLRSQRLDDLRWMCSYEGVAHLQVCGWHVWRGVGLDGEYDSRPRLHDSSWRMYCYFLLRHHVWCQEWHTRKIGLAWFCPTGLGKAATGWGRSANHNPDQSPKIAEEAAARSFNRMRNASPLTMNKCALQNRSPVLSHTPRSTLLATFLYNLYPFCRCICLMHTV